MAYCKLQKISRLCRMRNNCATRHLNESILLLINAQTSALQADALFWEFSRVKAISYTKLRFCLCFETNMCIFWLCFETNMCIFWLCFETNCSKNICVIQRFLVPLQRKIKLTYVSTKNYTRFAHLGSL